MVLNTLIFLQFCGKSPLFEIHLYIFPVIFAALILEEIAIDSHNKAIEDRLLHEAQDLHLASLALAKKAFGEDNVQTAKHYGNLGRLYQSMHRFEVSIDSPSCFVVVSCFTQKGP